jgi:glycosyltransferase involved in cell wall biosynthesis
MTTVAFFVRHFSERGTEVAIYDYALHNETVLNNKSIIVCFTPEKQRQMGFSDVRFAYPKFAERFTILELDDIADIDVKSHNIDVFHTLTHGEYEDTYQFENKSIWEGCRTIVHCVFETRNPHGDVYIAISDALNLKFGTTIPVVPHMIHVDSAETNLREELGIPNDAIVFGRYGGRTTFYCPHAIEAVKSLAGGSLYFIFMCTPHFIDHPNVKFLGVTTDMKRKREFINTCDAFLHGQPAGETFGLAVGEFAVCLKPIFTYAHPSLCNNHILTLGEKAIIYVDTADLIEKITNFRPKNYDMKNNGYCKYLPELVMPILAKHF